MNKNNKVKKNILLFLDINGVLAFSNYSKHITWLISKEMIAMHKGMDIKKFKNENFFIPHFDPIALCNFRALIERNRNCNFYICFITSHRKEISENHPLGIRKDMAKMLKACIPNIDKMIIGTLPKDRELSRAIAIAKYWITNYSKSNYKLKFDKVIVIDDRIEQSSLPDPITVFRPKKEEGFSSAILKGIENHIRKG